MSRGNSSHTDKLIAEVLMALFTLVGLGWQRRSRKRHPRSAIGNPSIEPRTRLPRNHSMAAPRNFR